MSATHHFKVLCTPHGANTEVLMDGEPLKGARSIHIATSVHEATVVTVEFINVTAELEGDALLETTEFGAEHVTYRGAVDPEPDE